MACASCGRRSPLASITQFYCSKCRTLLCGGCLDPKDGTRVCPACGRNVSSPGSAAFAFVAIVLLLSLIIAIQSAITTMEEELAWDSMDVVPFENAEDRSYIKIVGRIDSDSDIPLDRIIYPNGTKEWRVMDFNLTYGTSSIFVNMSDFDTLVRNDASDHPNGSYLDGELIYVVGLIYYEGDNLSILANNVVYDTEIFEELFHNYDVAAVVVVIGALPLTFILTVPIISRLILPPLKRLSAVPQKEVPVSRTDPKVVDAPPAFRPIDPLPPAARHLENAILITIAVLLLVNLYWSAYFIQFFLVGENIFESMGAWNSFLSLLFIALGSSLLYGLILLIHPKILIYVEPTVYHLHFAFGFGPIQMIEWSTVTDVKHWPYALQLTTEREEIFLLPLFRTAVRRDIAKKAREAIERREEEELQG